MIGSGGHRQVMYLCARVCVYVIEIVSHVWMSHVTRMNPTISTTQTGNVFVCVCVYVMKLVSHVWMSHVTLVNRQVMCVCVCVSERERECVNAMVCGMPPLSVRL